MGRFHCPAYPPCGVAVVAYVAYLPWEGFASLSEDEKVDMLQKEIGKAVGLFRGLHLLAIQ